MNGKKVTSIVDITYAASYGIDFGISDIAAKKPPQALFSAFSYTPLPDSKLSNSILVANDEAKQSTSP